MVHFAAPDSAMVHGPSCQPSLLMSRNFSKVRDFGHRNRPPSSSHVAMEKSNLKTHMTGDIHPPVGLLSAAALTNQKPKILASTFREQSLSDKAKRESKW